MYKEGLKAGVWCVKRRPSRKPVEKDMRIRCFNQNRDGVILHFEFFLLKLRSSSSLLTD